MEASLPRRCLAELIGTFCLVLVGTGAVVINASHPDDIGHLGISLAFGFIVMMMIYAIGDISGAHINPAVSIAFTAAGKLGLRELSCYAASQFIGAILGSYVVLKLFGDGGRLGVTSYECGTGTAIAIEFLMSAMLMFVIMGFVTEDKQKASLCGLVVGGTIAVEALIAGPITGASMNPARSLGPALIGQDLGKIWIYLLAPCFGTLGGLAAYKAISPKA